MTGVYWMSRLPDHVRSKVDHLAKSVLDLAEGRSHKIILSGDQQVEPDDPGVERHALQVGLATTDRLTLVGAEAQRLAAVADLEPALALEIPGSLSSSDRRSPRRVTLGRSKVQARGSSTAPSKEKEQLIEPVRRRFN